MGHLYIAASVIIFIVLVSKCFTSFYDDIGHKPYRPRPYRPQTTSTSDNRPMRTARMPCEMRTGQNSNTRRLRPTDGLLKPTQATTVALNRE